MEGKARRFPYSLSLGDLRTISAPADLESSIESTAWNLRGASFSKTKNLPSRSIWKIAALTSLCTILLTLLLYLSFTSGRVLWNQGINSEPMHFAIVIDCGSTSTRVYVYGWLQSRNSLPVMYRPPSHDNSNSFLDKSKPTKAYHRMETEPGFHQLVHNTSGLAAALSPLLDWAEHQIPSRLHSETPLFLLGTAGLRKLPTSDSEWLLDNAWKLIKSSPFKCRRSWLRIISGVEEAYYGWVALNYSLQRFGRSAKASGPATVGSLDLGGSSLEVTFEPDGYIRSKYSVNLSIGPEEHHVYAYSHAGYGLNDAFEKSVALLTLNSENVSEVRHPCLHSEYRQSFTCFTYCARLPMELVGDPNWEKCQQLARSVVNSSRFQRTKESECQQASCALGKYQPQATGKFYAVAGFFVMYKFFGLSSSASLDELLHKGHEFCQKPWPVARDSVVPQVYIDRYCFRAPYVVSLLRDGLHLRDDQVSVGRGDITWTQGAALLEAGVLERNSRRRTKWFQNAVFIFPVTLFLLLVIVIAIFMVCCSRKQGYVLPFDAKQAASTTGTSRWSLNFMKRFGGVKSPQSPAPTPPRSFFQEEQQTSRIVSTQENIPLLLESDPLRLPPAGPGQPPRIALAKMQPKGGSRLQSRRTPSKEDLNILSNHR